MLKGISRTRLAGFWFGAVAVITAWVVATGMSVTTSTAALLLTMSLVPPAVMFLLWPGVPPQTVREIMYSANKPKEGRS